MMEYTMARMALAVCGVIMLAAVVPPVTTLFNSEESADMQYQTENICKMLDTFYDSAADDMILSMNTILPQSSSLKIENRLITLIDDDKEYRAYTEYPVIADKNVYMKNDCVSITKCDDSIVITTL